MQWQPGTKVRHEFFGTYIIQGPPVRNEIGYTLVPVQDDRGARHYMSPKNLTKVGGVNCDTVCEHRHAPGDVPGVQAAFF